MKEKGQGNQSGSRRKVVHCKNCGRIQSYTNYECEGCGIDLTFYGKIEFVEDGSSHDVAANRRKEEERRKRAEEERRKREEEEARRRAGMEKERLRQEKARRRAEEEHRIAEERRKEQLLRQQQAEAAAKKKAEEEKRLAAERKRQEQLQAEQEAARKRQNGDEKRCQAREDRRNRQKVSHRRGDNNAASNAKSVLLMVPCVLVCGLAVFALLMHFVGLNPRRCGEDLTWRFDEETATLTIEGTGEMYSYTSAPEGGLGVVQIPSLDEPPWMEKYGQKIQRVVIGEDVSSIGSCAFAGCHNLESIYLGQNVERIEQCAFYNTSMESVIIPESVYEIEWNAFAYIDELRNVFFNGDPEMNLDVFTWHDRLILFANGSSDVEAYAESLDLIFVDSADTWNEEEIVGEEDVYKRLNHFFGGQSDDGNLQWKINIDTRLMTLTGSGPMEDFNGKWMLDNADNMESWVEGRNFPYWTDYTRIIESLVIEEGLTRIGDSAFEQCYNMRKAILPNTLEYIGFQSFLSAGLVRITVPEGVTGIHDHAFNFCEHLQFADLPESLERLHNGTFNMCNALRSLKIGENTEVAHRDGEDGCNGIFSNGDNPKGRPDSLTIIGKLGSDAQGFAQEENFAFSPNGLKPGTEDSGKCGDKTRWKFAGDQRTLYIEGSGSTWSYHLDQLAIDTWAEDLYKKDQIREGDPEFLIYAKYIEHIVVKKGVTTLGHNLFSWHDDPKLVNLKTVDYGSVKRIQANLKRTKLETVEFPDTVIGIDGCALADNDYLKTVVIRNGSEWIGTGLLYNCNRLERVELHGKEKIEDYNGGDLFNSPGDLPEWNLPGCLQLFVMHGSEGEQMAREKKIPCGYLD